MIHRLKLISNGHVMDFSKSLLAQKVTNNSLVLAVILSSDPGSQKVFINYFEVSKINNFNR